MPRVRGVREARLARHRRVRRRVAGTPERPRLCVFRSLRYLYAQVIDDTRGHTLASASSREAQLQQETDKKTKTERSKLLGALVAQRALEQGVKQVVFDRGGYKYHGRIRAFAEAAREGGLDF